jgi:hypothetical protein
MLSALVGGEWSASHPGRFTTGARAPGTNWIGPQRRSGQRGEEKILDATETRTPTLGHPARRQSLYRLSYPGSIQGSIGILIESNKIVMWLVTVTVFRRCNIRNIKLGCKCSREMKLQPCHSCFVVPSYIIVLLCPPLSMLTST